MKQPSEQLDQVDTGTALIHRNLRYLVAGGAFITFLGLPLIITGFRNMDVKGLTASLMYPVRAVLEILAEMGPAAFTVYWYTFFMLVMGAISLFGAVHLMNEQADAVARERGSRSRSGALTPEMKKIYVRGNTVLWAAVAVMIIGWIFAPSGESMNGASSHNSLFSAQLAVAILVHHLSIVAVLAAFTLKATNIMTTRSLA